MNVLSVQSSVAYGHVGNAAATLPLQRLGHEVWGMHTVQFSNHPGHGRWRGRVTPAAEIAELLDGVAELGLLGQCDAILSGYLGEAATGDAVMAALARGRAASPKLVYCCDPVMGDDEEGLYVRPGLPEFFRQRGVPAADILTPNRFELELLSGVAVRSLADVRAAADSIRARGPSQILVSGLEHPILPAGKIGAVLIDNDGAWLVATPRIAADAALKGTGDVLTALYLGHRLRGEPSPVALGKSVSGVFALVGAAAQTGLRELPLAAAQDRMIGPDIQFLPEAL